MARRSTIFGAFPEMMNPPMPTLSPVCTRIRVDRLIAWVMPGEADGDGDAVALGLGLGDAVALGLGVGVVGVTVGVGVAGVTVGVGVGGVTRGRRWCGRVTLRLASPWRTNAATRLTLSTLKYDLASWSNILEQDAATLVCESAYINGARVASAATAVRGSSPIVPSPLTLARQ